jgi:hypothetical protein
MVDSAPAKQFFRLEFYDSSVSPLPAVLTANFDGDIADNKTELDQGTDLFGLTFGDPDSLFDEWEYFYFGGKKGVIPYMSIFCACVNRALISLG